MLPRVALLIVGLVLAGTMPATAAADCVEEPDQHETFVSPLNKNQYVYVIEGEPDDLDATTNVAHIGIWEESNGVEHLQTKACRTPTGSQAYPADRKVAGSPLP